VKSARAKAKVMAVLGKGGAGKTVFSALIARACLERGLGPLLLVDADPTGGLVHAVGAGLEKTIGVVREKLIETARDPDMDAERVTETIDWQMLDALQEHEGYSLLAMGSMDTKGCFCPLNSLLRAAIGKLSAGFQMVLIDAEAGVEQVNRQVFDRVDYPVVISDGSLRGLRTAESLVGLLKKLKRVSAPGLVLNRTPDQPAEIPEGFFYLGNIPQDDEIRRRDAEGLSLLDLPGENLAVQAVGQMLSRLLDGKD